MGRFFIDCGSAIAINMRPQGSGNIPGGQNPQSADFSIHASINTSTFVAGRVSVVRCITEGDFYERRSQVVFRARKKSRHGTHMPRWPGCISGKRTNLSYFESNWHQQRLLLFVLEGQWRYREFLHVRRWPLHIELERHQQLGRRQGLADGLTQDRELFGHIQFARQRLPDSLRMDHQPADRVLHRRQLGHVPSAGWPGIHGHGDQ